MHLLILFFTTFAFALMNTEPGYAPHAIQMARWAVDDCISKTHNVQLQAAIELSKQRDVIWIHIYQTREEVDTLKRYKCIPSAVVLTIIHTIRAYITQYPIALLFDAQAAIELRTEEQPDDMDRSIEAINAREYNLHDNSQTKSSTMIFGARERMFPKKPIHEMISNMKFDVMQTFARRSLMSHHTKFRYSPSTLKTIASKRHAYETILIETMEHFQDHWYFPIRIPKLRPLCKLRREYVDILVRPAVSEHEWDNVPAGVFLAFAQVVHARIGGHLKVQAELRHRYAFLIEKKDGSDNIAIQEVPLRFPIRSRRPSRSVSISSDKE